MTVGMAGRGAGSTRRLHPRWRAALQEGPSLRRPILKPCKFAVKPVCDRRATADRKVPGTCTREAGLDRALGKDSAGTYRKDGQDRAPPRPVATACSNHPGQSRSAAGQPSDKSHVTHYPGRIGLNF